MQAAGRGAASRGLLVEERLGGFDAALATLSPSVTWPLPPPGGPATTTAAASSRAALARSWWARAAKSWVGSSSPSSPAAALFRADATHASVRASAVLGRVGTLMRRWLELRARGGAPPLFEVVLLRRCRSSPPRGVSGWLSPYAAGARTGAGRTAAELVLVRGPPNGVVVVGGSHVAAPLVCHSSRDTLRPGGRRSDRDMTGAAPLRGVDVADAS